MFVERTHMVGLCSTMKSETKHFFMNQIKKCMSAIDQDQLRCEKMSQQQQEILIPGIHKISNFFDEEEART